MRDSSSSDSRMPLNTVDSASRDYVLKDENIFNKFEEFLLDEKDEKLIKGWIFDNQDVLNGKFGKKLETPLHRSVLLS